MTIQAWPFLVGRSKKLGYQTVVCPQFISEAGVALLLAEAAGGEESVPNSATYREVLGSPVGDISLVFHVVKAKAEDYDIEGNEILRDRNGRSILLVEGFVVQGRESALRVTRGDLQITHEKVKGIYHDFWQAQTNFQDVSSLPFELLSENQGAEWLDLIKEDPLDLRSRSRKAIELLTGSGSKQRNNNEDNQDRPSYSRERYVYPLQLYRSLLPAQLAGRNRLMIIVAFLSLVLIIIFGSTTAFLAARRPSPNPVSSPRVSRTPTPTSGLPCVVNISTWTGGSQDWIVDNGVLYNDGSNGQSTGPTIIAPCQPRTLNYAVEAKIQLTDEVSGCFGITLRTSYATSVCNDYTHDPPSGTAYIYRHSTILTSVRFSLGTTLHTYRAEVRDNTIKFFIDNNLVATTIDNRLLTSEKGETTGLYSQSLQLQVTSFQVTALS